MSRIRLTLALCAAVLALPLPAAADREAIPPVDGVVVAPFDPPATPWGPGHRGVDLDALPGDPVRAALGGRVSFAGVVAGVGWVTVDHGGSLDTTYGPLEPRLVETGEDVRAGQVLGHLSDGAAHLDWGARVQRSYIDPLTLLRRWHVRLVPLDEPVGVLPAGGGQLIWPVAGHVTSGFGPRIHPVTGERRHHDGIDFAAPAGTRVGAAGGGVVTFAGWRGGYGNLVVIDHGGGLATRYAHLSRVDVAVGQSVAAGERLGLVGSTGVSTGPHLHFEVHFGGTAVDPRPLLG